jgi:hypothetical protein
MLMVPLYLDSASWLISRLSIGRRMKGKCSIVILGGLNGGNGGFGVEVKISSVEP